MEEKIEEAGRIIKKCSFLLVITGAGISAESGIPTFRGRDGLWNRYSPSELATPQAFSKNPHLVWEWYEWRRSIIKKAKPNPGHIAITEIEKIKQENFKLITQNIDGLHKIAGSRRMIEFHGNIWREKCISCEYKQDVSNTWDEGKRELPPQCPKCTSILRPDVVWFGENIPKENIEEAEKALSICDVLLYVGTSALVYPVASFIEYAIETGREVIEINLEKTNLSDRVSISIEGKAGEILPKIVEVIRGNTQ